MNILPHKSWHVRTKANIAKVRKDQNKAAEDEREQQRKIALADQEVRIEILRKRANASKPINASQSDTPDATTEIDADETGPEQRLQDEEIGDRVRNSEHINLFADLDNAVKPNAAFVKEKKDEQEKYEKQIGYLTYFGQDTNEALGKRDWYEKVPEKNDPYDRLGQKQIEVGLKAKFDQDPLNIIKKHLGPADNGSKKASPSFRPIVSELVRVVSYDENIKDKLHKDTHHRSDNGIKKHKKKKDKVHKSHIRKEKSSSHSKKRIDEDRGKIERMRAERLQREQMAKNKVKILMDTINPPVFQQPSTAETPKVVYRPPKYNSQYNPKLSKQ